MEADIVYSEPNYMDILSAMRELQKSTYEGPNVIFAPEAVYFPLMDLPELVHDHQPCEEPCMMRIAGIPVIVYKDEAEIGEYIQKFYALNRRQPRIIKLIPA